MSTQRPDIIHLNVKRNFILAFILRAIAAVLIVAPVGATAIAELA